jgi:NADH dehydrogenase FAD-containing subunit
MAKEQMAKKKVLILGGGFAGARLATLLADSLEVTLVDKKAYYEIVFANHRAAVEPEITKHTILPFEVRTQAPRLLSSTEQNSC